MSTPRERGSTLIELLVVLAILGVLAGVVGLAAHTAGSTPVDDGTGTRLAAARREALGSGRAVRITLTVQGRAVDATAWPDGSVSADTALAVDRLSGRRRDPH